MTKTKSTKHALLMSGLALLMCVSMLIGSTFAWFTDSVTSAGNKIQAGTLKIDLELLEKNEDGSTKWTSLKDSKAPIFNYDKWEPGYTDVKILKVENEGTLALKWVAKFVSANDLTELANVIDVYVKPSADEFGYATDRTDLSTWTKKGTVAEFVNTISETTYGNLEAGKAAYLGIALKMQESADNKYQGMDLGGAFDIMILATQYTSESDSFDDQYDKNATYLNKDESGNYLISTAAELVYFADSVNNGKKTYAGETVMLTADIDLANVAWSPIGQTCATEFKGVFDGQNHTIKNMTIVNTDESANCASGLFGWIESHDNNNPVTVKNVKFDNANVTGNHNVAVVAGYIYGTIENCEVKNSTVIGLNANDDANGDKVGVIAGYVGDSRINNNKVENCVVKGNRDVGGLAGVVHTGVLSFKNNSVKNTSVYYVTDRSYASAGELFSGRTTYTADSTNAVSGNKVMKGINVATAADLLTALNNLSNGQSVTLTQDIDLTGVDWSVSAPWQGPGTEVVFDGAGHKITGLTTNGLQGGLFGSYITHGNVTIKNLTLETVNLTGTDVDGVSAGGALIGWYESHGGILTIENVEVNGVNVKGFKYIGGLIGYVNPGYGVNIIDCSINGTELTSTYNESGNYKGHIGGLVGYYGKGTVTNCTVSDLTIKRAGTTAQLASSSNRAGALFGTVEGNCTVVSATVSTVTVDGVNASSDNVFGPAASASTVSKNNININ